jgi:hypothetical protein
MIGRRASHRTRKSKWIEGHSQKVTFNSFPFYFAEALEIDKSPNFSASELLYSSGTVDESAYSSKTREWFDLVEHTLNLSALDVVADLLR